MSPRNASPSPSFRERQRTVRGQSISYQSQLSQQQPSPTTSVGSYRDSSSKRSPPPSAQIHSSVAPLQPGRKLPSPNRPDSPDEGSPPPPPVHSMSQPNIHHTMPPPPQHSLSYSSVPTYNIQQQQQQGSLPRSAGDRVPPPQLMSLENMQMTPQFMAEIDQAHAAQLASAGSDRAGTVYSGSMGGGVARQSPQNLYGTSGVAYAGGASTNSLSKAVFESGSPPRDPAMERLRASERSSPKEPDANQWVAPPSSSKRDSRELRERERERELRHPDMQRRGSLKRELPPQPQPSQGTSSPSRDREREREVDRDDSPAYHTPVGSPGEHQNRELGQGSGRGSSGGVHNPYESRQQPLPTVIRVPTPPALAPTKTSYSSEPRGTPPTSAKLSAQTPPLSAMKAITPDKSLPFQEEPEDDVAIAVNVELPRDRDPSSGRDGRERWNSPSGGNEYARHDQHSEPARPTVVRHIYSPRPSADINLQNFNRFDAPADSDRAESRNGRPDAHREVEPSYSNGGGDIYAQDSQDEGSGTPRSPVQNLPPDNVGQGQGAYSAGKSSPARQQTLRRVRNSSTDHAGLRSFDTTVYEHEAERLKPASTSPAEQHAQARTHQSHSHSQSLPQSQSHPHPPHAQSPPQQHSQHQQESPPKPQAPQPQPSHSHLLPQPHQLHYGRIPNNILYQMRPHLEPEHFLDDPVAAYYQSMNSPVQYANGMNIQYTNSPVSTNSRPNAPIPPTPHSQTAPPSPSPLLSGHNINSNARPHIPFSPIPPGGSPYPYPYGHIRRNGAQQSVYAPTESQTGMTDMQFDEQQIRDQLALQMQIYALNNGGMVTDSTLSPSSTPFPGPHYNPWQFLQTTRVFGEHGMAGLRGSRGGGGGGGGGGSGGGGMDSSASIRSSPSHEPVHLPMPTHILGARNRLGVRKKEKHSNLRVSQGGTVRQKVRPPPRVESTQPRETSPELSSGEETAGESKVGAGDRYAATPSVMSMAERMGVKSGWNVEESTLDDADGMDSEWVDEVDVDGEGEEEEMLQLEYHANYVNNPEKRRRRWKTRWEELIRAFQALDRETDTTLVLLAAPSHASTLHSVTSRSLRRDPSFLESTPMNTIRNTFSQIAAKREAARIQHTSILERLSTSLATDSSSTVGSEGSPSLSSSAKEEDLRRALEAALGSLSAVQSIYEQREMRWVDEMRRLDEDREKVNMLLGQVLGVGFSPSLRTAASNGFNMGPGIYGPPPAVNGSMRNGSKLDDSPGLKAPMPSKPAGLPL